jgi:ABC-type transport system substrate-binding protein
VGLPDEGGLVTNTYDRRQFLAHSAAAAGGVVVAGALVDELAAGPAGAITKGGTLKVGLISEQNKPFSPPYANMDLSGFCYARTVYDPLCVVSSDGKTVYPYLCESVTPNASFNQWTITARPGVKFHNNKPCNGDAIFANLMACYNSVLTGPVLKQLVSAITHTAGTSTVVVHTKYKWTSFPYSLSEQQICFIAEPTTLKDVKTINPVGTGPFVFSSWNYNTSFICSKNTNYWRAGLPYLDSIELHPVPDDTTRMQALQDGNLDMIIEATGTQLVKFPTLGGGYNYVTDIKGKLAYSPSSNCIMMNCTKAPFNNLEFRKACAYAIDRATFNTVIDKGQSTPIDGIYLPGSQYYKKPAYPAYSVALAKSTLKKVPASVPRKFTLTCVNSPIVTESAEFIQSELKVIGITVTLNPVEQGTLIGDAIYGQYQAMTWSQFGGVSPDTNYPWFSAKVTGLNFAKNYDPKILSAMYAGMAATTTAARVKAWSFVNDQLGKDIPYLWTDRAIIGIAAHTDVQNWKTFTDPAGHQILQPNEGVMFYTEIWKS